MWGMKEWRSAPIIVAAVAIPLLLFVVYVAAYCAMLGRQGIQWNEDYSHEIVPIYRIDNTLTQSIFSPANQIDRLVRPDHWEPVQVDVQKILGDVSDEQRESASQ